VSEALPTAAGSGQNILTAAKGGGISFAGKLFEYVIRFVFSILVARTIGAQQFGLYTLGVTVAEIVTLLALLGLQTGMVRYLPIALRRRDEASMWGIIQVGAAVPALLGLILAGIMFLLAEPLANQLFHAPSLAPLLRLVALVIPLDALSFIAFTVILSFKQLQYSTLANNVVLPLVKLFLTIGLLVAGMGTLGIMAAHVTASAVGLALLVYFVNHLFPLNRPLSAAKRNPGELLRFSLPAHLAWAINAVRGSLETLVLGFVGLTTGVGVYTAALRLSTIGNMFYTSIASISAPIISDLHSRGESGQLEWLYQTTNKWLVTFNLPLFLTCVIFAAPLLSIFGADFASGATGLIIMAAGTLANTSTGVGATVIDMTGHTKVNFVNSMVLVVVAVGFDLFLIPRWGVIGAALASSLSVFLVNLLCLGEVFFLHRILPYNRSFIKPIVAGLVAVGITYLLIQQLSLSPLLSLVVGSPVLWGTFALVIMLLGFSAEDRLVLGSLRSRLQRTLEPVTGLARHG
jgi:O-antigen/teichoic acid export membrane protein